MSKVQIKTEIDLLAVLPQLETSDLERYAKEIAKLLIQRKAKSKKAKIAELLRRLNEECVLPEGDLDRFYELKSKREKAELPPKELKTFFKLIQEEEKLRIKRIEVLGELAQLKDIPLAKLNKELGIKIAKRA